MADVTLFGVIERIKCSESFVSVTVLERRLGYRRKDGTQVEEAMLSYRILFKSNMRKYITGYFQHGNLVKVKGTFLPYCTNKEGVVKEGYTILGQTIEYGVYPRMGVDVEKKLVSLGKGNLSQPDVDFMEDDF